MAVTFRLDVRVPLLQRFALATLTRELQRYENDWAKGLVGEARIYPPRRRGQTYVRTYRFKRGWRIIPSRFVGSDLVVRVENDTPYARKVVGNDRGLGQSGYHVGRWFLFRDLAASRDFARGAQAIITAHLRNATFTSTTTP